MGNREGHSPLILSPEWRRRREASFSYQLPRSTGGPVPTTGATLPGRCRAEVSVWVRNPQQWLRQVHHPAPAGVPTVPAFPTYGTSHLLPVASVLLVQRGFQGIPAWHSGTNNSKVRGTKQVDASFFLCRWVVLRCTPYCFSVHGNKPQLTHSGFQVTTHPRLSLLFLHCPPLLPHLAP